MTKLLICHGLPGSGKSTWAEKVANSDSHGRAVRINRDDIRTVLAGDGYHSRGPNKKVEKQVTALRDQLISECLTSGSALPQVSLTQLSAMIPTSTETPSENCMRLLTRTEQRLVISTLMFLLRSVSAVIVLVVNLVAVWFQRTSLTPWLGQDMTQTFLRMMVL